MTHDNLEDGEPPGEWQGCDATRCRLRRLSDENRPRLVEGNKGPDLDLTQRSHVEPFGNARFGQLLAYNLRRGK
jgi:hypothetical protein